MTQQQPSNKFDFCGNFDLSSEGNSGTIVEKNEAKFTRKETVVNLYNASYFEAAHNNNS